MKIVTKTVREVLLPDGGWHKVIEGSFSLDSFFEKRGDAGHSALWFRFQDFDDGRMISGPIASIQAITNE